MGGDEHRQAFLLCSLHQRLDVRHRAVGGHALAHESPRDPVLAQEIVLRVGDDDRGALAVDLETGVGQQRLGEAACEYAHTDCDSSERLYVFHFALSFLGRDSMSE